MRRLLAASTLALLLSAWLHAAAGDAADNLARHIAAGKWEFTYQRFGEFKPLFYRHREQGSSHTCIDGDPRQHLMDWLARKGCSVSQEAALADGHLFSGQCRLKWMPGEPVPVDVKLSWVDERSFVMDIRTREHPYLIFAEHTLATHQGPCSLP